MDNVININHAKPTLKYITEETESGFSVTGVEGVEGGQIVLIQNEIVMTGGITKEELFAFMMATPLYNELVECRRKW